MSKAVACATHARASVWDTATEKNIYLSLDTAREFHCSARGTQFSHHARIIIPYVKNTQYTLTSILYRYTLLKSSSAFVHYAHAEYTPMF